jgi:hypothetical protein
MKVSFVYENTIQGIEYQRNCKVFKQFLFYQIRIFQRKLFLTFRQHSSPLLQWFSSGLNQIHLSCFSTFFVAITDCLKI